MMDYLSQMKNKAAALPGRPGVYQFIDTTGKIIYVGKAKDLRKRVTSYFGKTQVGKTGVMVAKVRDIRHIVVDNESEALLLENNLIKEHQPRYNVLMKDDKTYPWIVIRNEAFPRVHMTRNRISDGSVYFGPYTSALMARTLLELIRQIYPLRNCSYNLSEEKIASSQYRVCLEYHLGNCLGPCEEKQEAADYNASVEQIKEILKGNINSVNRYLKTMMKSFAAKLMFEEAQSVKNKIDILARYETRSTVVNPRVRDVDVVGFSEDGDIIYVNYLRVVKGAVIQAYTLEFKRRIEESPDEIIALAINELRKLHNSSSKEIILPLIPDIQEDNLKYTVPIRGDKLKLLELARRNAVYFGLEKKKREISGKPQDKSLVALERMKADLRMPELPLHIECFDNSNIQGQNPVAACVVFRRGKPAKKEYRHYNIKTVNGPDDYASMEEIVYRRYRRLSEEGDELPQLIIIDGGKGQLNSAIKSLDRLELRGKITVIGIAKKLEEIYFPGDPVPIYIDKNSVSLKIIQHLRNEAHRFGITFHRNKRSSEMLVSKLDSIPGIGPVTKDLLLKKFATLENIRNIPLEELENLIGKSKARLIIDFFRKQD